MEKIDIGQPEAIVSCARYQAPGEASESGPVDAIRLEHHQDSEKPEQRKKEEIADDAQGDNAKHLTWDRQQGCASEDQVQAEANRTWYSAAHGRQQLHRRRARD